MYYFDDSPILDRINGGISAIETWFKATYGSDCVTTRTVNSPGSIRLHWQDKVAGIPGMTLEHAPKRTTFGTEASNEGADIANYSTNISTFVQEFLMEKYRRTESVAIQSVSAKDIKIPKGTHSATITADILPADTTQNNFKWVSSNENVVKVYGGTNKAVLVTVSAGTARITATNRHNENVSVSFEVTTEYEQGENSNLFSIGGVDSSTGEVVDNSARLISELIPIEAPCYLTVQSNNGYRINVFTYDANGVYLGNDRALGDMTTALVNPETAVEGISYIRVLMKKTSGEEFTADELASVSVTITAVPHSEDASAISAPAFTLNGVSSSNGTLTENAARLASELISIEHNDVVVFENANGYDCKVAFYNASKGFVAMGPPDFQKTCGCIVASNTLFMRITAKKADGSDFTETEAANAGFSGSVIEAEPQTVKVELGGVDSSSGALTDDIGAVSGNTLVYGYQNAKDINVKICGYDANGSIVLSLDSKHSNTPALVGRDVSNKNVKKVIVLFYKDAGFTELPSGLLYVNGKVYNLASE